MNNKNPFPFKGISEAEVLASRLRHGPNIISPKTGFAFIKSVKSIVLEPMFILLVACASVYFVVGAFSEAWFMSGAIILVSGISLYQDTRSKRALQALKEFTQAFSTVLRDDELLKIPSKEIVAGDYIVVDEGELIPADGTIRQVNDFSVNESILTGEAFSVIKEVEGENNTVYSGTLAASGQCVFEATAVGINTRLGRIGQSIENIQSVKTPLQVQINAFVKKMAMVGTVIFLVIWLINFIRSGSILDSLLSGLTIAMSVLPEEIPVAFASFMALGAYRLMKAGIIVKQTGTVEALGSATILCTDKTGTITENRMEVYQCYDFKTDMIYSGQDFMKEELSEIIRVAMFASESVPFDPMERALHQLYSETSGKDERPLFKMLHEYPLEGKPPMMTHIFRDGNGRRIIACKGAPERLMELAALSQGQAARISKINSDFGRQGLRVLAIATATFEGTAFPASQNDFHFRLLGLVAFYDPPKKNIASVFKTLYHAGIGIKVITGDNPETTLAICRQVGLRGYERGITGKELLLLGDNEFDHAVATNNIFSRTFPELKLRIIESLRAQNQVVGMTGDGVNDGPALKAADIGIAMGKRGSEIARASASLILTDDDFGKMVDAVAMGRRIYTNLKKAIQYIISIHIPIILTVAIPSVLGWVYPVIFTPVHVILLELIMGPTCSVIYENEPPEQNSMLQSPRKMTSTFFNLKELTISIFQGIGITAATIFMYLYSVQKGYNQEMTRSMVFSTLLLANILLTFVNRSFYYSVFTTLKYKNNLLLLMTSATAILLAMLLYIPFLAHFFKLVPLQGAQVLVCLAASFTSVIGFECYKLAIRSFAKKGKVKEHANAL